jgi:hypothetical protein
LYRPGAPLAVLVAASAFASGARDAAVAMPTVSFALML